MVVQASSGGRCGDGCCDKALDALCGGNGRQHTLEMSKAQESWRWWMEMGMVPQRETLGDAALAACRLTLGSPRPRLVPLGDGASSSVPCGPDLNRSGPLHGHG
jgi:hypothetical protein